VPFQDSCVTLERMIRLPVRLTVFSRTSRNGSVRGG
jgi:hypothetical protein